MRLDSAIAQALIALQGRADANETGLFARQLEYIYTELYNVEYPECQGRKLIPVDTRVGPGADSFTYRTFDKVGSAAIVHNYATDFPTAEVQGKETKQLIKSIGSSYQYSIQDMRAAQMAGYPLEMMKAQAARDFVEYKIDAIAATGDTNTGLYGLANAPGIQAGTLAAAGTWPTKTPTQILADLNALQSLIFTATKGIHTPDSMLVGTAGYAYLATTARSPTYTDDSMLQYILKQSPWLKSINYWARLDTAGASSKERVMLYEKNPRVVQLIIPQEFEQLPPQPRNMAFMVPCHARTGGVEVRYPMAVAYLDGTEP